MPSRWKASKARRTISTFSRDIAYSDTPEASRDPMRGLGLCVALAGEFRRLGPTLGPPLLERSPERRDRRGSSESPPRPSRKPSRCGTRRLDRGRCTTPWTSVASASPPPWLRRYSTSGRNPRSSPWSGSSSPPSLDMFVALRHYLASGGARHFCAAQSEAPLAQGLVSDSCSSPTPPRLGLGLTMGRRLPESNRRKRLCRPLRNHSAKAPRGGKGTPLCPPRRRG